MARPLNVLFLSSEVEPFAKTGGLADVSGALPQVLKALGQEVRVMMPRYGSINDRKSHLHEMIRLKDIEVPVGKKSYPASVKSSFLTSVHDKVQVYFLDNEHFFGRPGLYVHPESKKDYADNDERFIFFCRGVFESLRRMGWAPDIIHANDWPTGLVPAYLKTMYANDPLFKDTRTVFTIHNMAYQGQFPAASFAKTHLPPETFSLEGVEAYGKLNFLKAGLVYADAVTTVSQKYAEEICSSEEFGSGLQGVVAARRKHLTGIVNGVDYTQWDPIVDEHIPVIGMISRLADQKGFDILGEVLDEFLKLDLQFVVLGTGDKKYHDMFERAAKKHPTKMAVALTFNNSLAHLIEAGADMFLMPSRYEPCGLNQIYSLRYGTVPIVRATGGLEDTIDDISGSSGTGFKFTGYSGADLLKAVQRALAAFANQSTWKKLMRAGMAKDFSWEASAKKYLQVYRSLARK